ncbi:MAG: hypothetical protein QE265_01625 [Rhodoferax sp.]|nr:hypothetical protein [Rhodoferax sp.]
MTTTPSLLRSAAMVACLLLASTAMAQISPTDYNASKSRIKNDYDSAKKACDSYSGNARDICVAQAKGKESVALAELEHSYQPTLKTQYKLHVAQGEATYGVAKQQCDDLSGNPKSVCVKEAKAALTTTKADATIQMKTAQTNAAANRENLELRSDAAADKRAAERKVAEQKCDALASTAKDTCMADAKAKFGKQ